MSNLIFTLEQKKLISPPEWMKFNIFYLTITGSKSYGASDGSSDFDIYGVCFPPKTDLFPHLAGHIYGFDKFKPFDDYENHHVFDGDIEYDIKVAGIIKFFNLLYVNNPTCIDVLFSSHEEILNITKAGHLLRDNRKLFLHKGCYDTFKGYSFSQLHKMEIKNPKEGAKRRALVDKYGFDTKHAMHLVRLLLELEQILMEGDLDLKRNSDLLLEIRRGKWSIDEVKSWANEKEKVLETLLEESTLPEKPDRDAIKELLLACIEIQYGANDFVNPKSPEILLNSIKKQIEKAGF